MADECSPDDSTPAEDRSAADDRAGCKSVRRILAYFGYSEVRPTGSDEWTSLREINGRYGTTDETHVFLPGGGRPHVSLRDVESGEPVGRARKPPPESEEAMEEP